MTGVSFKVTAETSQADARLAAIDKTLVQIKGSANSLSNSLSNAFKSIAATVGLSAIALQLKSASDSAIQLENRMKTIADSSQGVADAMRTVRDLSMETRSAVDSTAELYQKYSKAAEQLAASSEEVLSVTRLTQQAIQLSGTSADSANAAVIQLGQGLGSGVLRGEELNSVLEQTPRLAQAIAQGLNIGVGQLRAMGAAGQLTSEAVFNSLLSQADQLNDEFARTTFTMTSQITNIKTALGVFTSEALKGVGEGGLGKLLGVVSEKIYARSDTIQTEVNKFVSSISLRLSSIKDLGSAMFDVGAALYRNFAVALPVIGYTRTALGDVYQDLRNIAGMLKSVFREPFAQLMEGAREADVFLKTGFGLFDWKVPAAMRDLFKAKSLIDFTEGLKKLASGVDSNTTFITNRLSSIPRALKYGFEDALIYVGILNKPFTMRMGYFEPLLDSLGEIKTGLIDGTKWAASFSGSLTPLGKIFGSLGGIIRNTAYLLYIAFASIAGVVGGLVTVLDQVLVRVVAFTRAFADNNTFSDIFESSQKYLGRALRNIEDFAKNVINEFFQIWDAVIGHSWWTDTIASIIDTSNSLWDKAGSGLSRFAKNTKNTFKGIYEDRPIGDMYDSGKKMLASAVVDLKIRVGEIDFIDIAKKTKDALVQAFNNLRENYKNILETAGIGLLFMGIVSLFPGAAIAQMISAKAVIAISAGLLVGSDRIIQQITGNSPLGEIAATMGEVLGRSLYRFITNIPHLLNAVMSAFTGLFRGFVSQLPMHIGDIAGAFLNIPVMGDIMGFVGALFFGKSVLGFLNTVGLVKLKAADIVTAFSRLFAIMPASPTGLVYKALFGPSAAGIIGLLMLINGGFDSLLGNSTLAKLIAGGGLAALIVRGMNAQNQGNTGNPSGTFFAGILQSLGKAKTALTGWGNSLMNMWAGVMNPPPISPSAILTPLQFMLLKVKAEIRAFIIGTQLVWGQMVMWMGVQWSRMTSFVSIQWGRMMAYMTATAAGGGFLATLSKGFLGIGAAATAGFGMASTALTGFWAKTMLFMKTPAFKYVALITGAMLATAIIAPEARAGEVPGEGNKATAAGASDGMTIIKDESPGIFSRMADWIIEAFETGMHFVSENFQAILLTVTLAGSTIMSIVTPIFTSIVGALGYIGPLFSLWGVTLTGTLGAIGAIITAPITLIVGALGLAGWGLLEAFGEGTTTADKWHNMVVDLKRALGMSPKWTDSDAGPELKKGFSKDANEFARNSGSVTPSEQDFNGIDMSMQSDAILKNHANATEAYNKALEQAARETSKGGEVSAGTWKEVDKQGKLWAKSLEKLRANSSGGDAKESLSKWLNAIPKEKDLGETALTSWAAMWAKGTVRTVGQIEKNKSGFNSSKEAEILADKIFALEEEAKRLATQKPMLDTFSYAALGNFFDTNKIGARLRDAKKEAGVSHTSESAYAAAKRWKGIEEAGKQADFVSTNPSKRFDYKEEGVALSALVAQAIGTSEALNSKDRLDAIKKALDKTTDWQKKASRKDSDTKTYEGKGARGALVESENDLRELVLKIIRDNERDTGVNKYNGTLDKLVKTAGNVEIKIDKEMLHFQSAFDIETLQNSVNTIGNINDLIAKGGTAEEMVSLIRQRAAESQNTNMTLTLANLRKEHDVRSNLIELAKKGVGSEKLLNVVNPRMSKETAEGFRTKAEDILKAKARLEEDIDRITAENKGVKGGLSEQDIRAKLLANIRVMEEEMTRAQEALLTPRENVLMQAEQLGLQLSEQMLKNLATDSGMNFATKWINRVRAAVDNLKAIPDNAPAAAKDKGAANVVSETAAGNRALNAPAPKMFSELISLIGVAGEDLARFGKKDFTSTMKAARDIEKIDDAISKLGANASQSQVDKQYSKKAEILRKQLEVTARYAYQTTEAIAGAFDSLGVAGATATPAIQAAVIGLASASDSLKQMAKHNREPGNYAEYQKTERSLARSRDLLKDIALTTPGDMMERINSQLKLSFTDESFSLLDDKLKMKLNNFAIYYRQAMAAVRDGTLRGEDAKNMVQRLEDGLRAAKFVAIFEGYGKAMAEAAASSAKTKFEALKSSGFDLKVSQETFNKYTPEARVKLSDQASMVALLDKLNSTEGGSVEMLTRINTLVNSNPTNDALKAGIADIQKQINDAMPDANPWDLAGKTLEPAHFRLLAKAIEENTAAVLGKTAGTVGATNAAHIEKNVKGAFGDAIPYVKKAEDPVKMDALRTSTNEGIAALRDRSMKETNGSGDAVNTLMGMIERLGLSIERNDLLAISPEVFAELKLKIERLDAALEYAKKNPKANTRDGILKARGELKDFTENSVLSTEEQARSAGSDFAKSMVSGVGDSLKGLMKGQTSFEELGRSLLDKFTSGVIDTFINGAMSSLSKSAGDMLSKFASDIFSSGGSSGGGLFASIGKLFMADGGYVSGSGTGTSDSIPAMLSNGEFVVNADATREYGSLLKRINSGKMPKFAAGGMVGGSSASLDNTAAPKETSTSVFNINITGDVSRQTRAEIQRMIPNIATGVGMYNKEAGRR